ncbi:AAA family ATPase [Candidatus Micrarchaeota archaeon]|nr:AAA family ATPase [Candidatus Micrarchaeota archaeon]
MRIAISGPSGCGNSTVTKLVSQKLNLKLVNYTFRNMAAEKGTTLEEIQKKALEDPKIDYLLDFTQVNEAADNSVLGSRLAIWLIDADLSVWLTASPRVRAKRIADRDQKSFSETLAFTRKRDKENFQRYKKYYGISINNIKHADLVVNTEKFSAEQVADIIIACAGLLKNNVPKRNKYAQKIKKVIEQNLSK